MESEKSEDDLHWWNRDSQEEATQLFLAVTWYIQLIPRGSRSQDLLPHFHISYHFQIIMEYLNVGGEYLF